jgi:WD40 repeat protein
VSGSVDKTVRVWDLERARETMTLRGHTSGVRVVAVASDGCHVVSGSDDGTIKVWDLERGEALNTLRGHTAKITAVAVTPDDRHVVSTSDDTTLKVWDLRSGQELRSCVAHGAGVAAMAMTADGRHALTAGGHPEMMHEVEVWDVAREEEVCVVGHGRDLGISFALTPDGRCAVSAHRSRMLKFWDLARLEGRCSVGPTLAKHHRRFLKRTARVNSLKELHAPRAIMRNEGSMLSQAKDGLCQALDAVLQQSEVVHATSDQRWDLVSVALKPDGRRAVSMSREGTLRVWDVRGKTVLAEFNLDNIPSACGLTPDGTTIVVGEESGTVHFLRFEGIEPSTGDEPTERPAEGRQLNLIASLCGRLSDA